MRIHLVSGGCGFVGRNMVKRLSQNRDDYILFVDDLSVGQHPEIWLGSKTATHENGLEIYGNGKLLFLKQDFRKMLDDMLHQTDYIFGLTGLALKQFSDVFHFAAIVGGRAVIDGDPMKVALDLAIDAEFFYWASRHRPGRILYPSSSAAYPIGLQADTNFKALKEADIDFNNLRKPDMTYGWSKLTGEYLASLAHSHYGLNVTCVRPFSGYGEDQDLSYPIPAIVQRIVGRQDPIQVWGSGEQGRDFVHIDDVLDCILLAMDHSLDASPMNIGSGRLTSFLEVIDILKGIAEYRPEIERLLDKPMGVQHRYGDMQYTFSKLGWRPRISLEDGLRRVYEKIRKEEEV